MERYERPERWKRHPPDSPEISLRSQMGDRERAEAGSAEVPRRAVRNWAYLVEAAVRAEVSPWSRMSAPPRVLRNWEYLVEAATKRADLEAGDQSAQTDIERLVAADLDSATTLIEAVVELVDEIRADAIDCRVAYILSCYAYRLAAQLESSTEGRCLLQFKSALKCLIMQKSCHTGNCSHSEDTLEIIDCIRKLRWEEDIVNLEAEEHAAQEGWALEGEDPSYHAWRMEKLSRFYEILNILNKALQFYSADVESKIGSIRINNPFHHYQPVDLVDLHQKLFIASTSFVSYREQPSLEIIMTTAAAFFKLHDETLARDLEQIVNVNAPINKSSVSNIILKILNFYGRITNNNAPKRIFNMPITSPFSLLKTRNLLSLCMEEVQKSAKHFNSKGASVAYVMNGNQCYLLVHVLQETERTLARVFQLQPLEVHPISVLGELLLTLHEAHILIDASCITRSESQWLREAFEQGDMSHTFSQVLYNIIWHSCVLWDMVACDNCIRESYELFFKCKGQFGRIEALEVLLSEAVEKDEKSLKHRLKIMKVVDPMNQGLAHQVLDRMEAPSSNLVFLNLDDFDLKGAPHIGSGSYGAVVRYNFLGRQCAMKVIKGIHGHEGDFEKEIDVAKKLGNHPNLVRLHCYSKTKVACYLIMEEL